MEFFHLLCIKYAHLSMRRFFRRNTDGPHNHTIIHQLLLQFLRHYREFSPATLVIIAAKIPAFHFEGMHRLEIE